MWVAELGCEAGHGFEGYFGSKDDFDSQRSTGLLSCPVCGSVQVDRRLSAPRLNLGAAEPLAPPPQADVRELLQRLRQGSEDVGSRFPTEARRIHQGDAPERAIRGQASANEVEALLDEGIAVLPLPDLDPTH